MDGIRGTDTRDRTWASVVNNGSSVQEPSNTNQTRTTADNRLDTSSNNNDLRTATQHRRIPSIQWGTANNSILRDPCPDDDDPFAAFPPAFLMQKAHFCVKANHNEPLADQRTPTSPEAMPDFGAIHHLNAVLARTMRTDPSTALRETLALAPGEYLVIPLDRALNQLDSETVTRARFSLQDIEKMAENTQYPLRFSLGGETLTPGLTVHRLTQRQTARDQLNGFWMTFSHYAESSNLSDRVEFIQNNMQRLMEKYIAYENKPELQEALSGVAKFFHAVFQTADFNDLPHRPILLQQLMDIFDAALDDDYLLESLAKEAQENMTNCADRRALVLGDMEMMVLMHRCAIGMSTDALFEAGLSLMRTQICDAHAFQSAQVGQEDETIEVLLRFRVALASHGLAVSNQHMAHEAVAQVEGQEIDRAAAAIEEATQDLDQVKNFFKHCTPWLEHIERSAPDKLTALSEQAQTTMADLFAQRQTMSEQAYVEACDTLMAQWHTDKSKALAQISDQVVTQLHQNYWQHKADSTTISSSDDEMPDPDTPDYDALDYDTPDYNNPD